MYVRTKELEDGDTLKEDLVEYSNSSEEHEEESSDDDDEGWITPSNVDEMNKAMGGVTGREDNSTCTVGCLTTDFAMQASSHLICDEEVELG